MPLAQPTTRLLSGLRLCTYTLQAIVLGSPRGIGVTIPATGILGHPITGIITTDISTTGTHTTMPIIALGIATALLGIETTIMVGYADIQP